MRRKIRIESPVGIWTWEPALVRIKWMPVSVSQNDFLVGQHRCVGFCWLDLWRFSSWPNKCANDDSTDNEKNGPQRPEAQYRLPLSAAFPYHPGKESPRDEKQTSRRSILRAGCVKGDTRYEKHRTDSPEPEPIPRRHAGSLPRATAAKSIGRLIFRAVGRSFDRPRSNYDSTRAGIAFPGASGL